MSKIVAVLNDDRAYAALSRVLAADSERSLVEIVDMIYQAFFED